MHRTTVGAFAVLAAVGLGFALPANASAAPHTNNCPSGWAHGYAMNGKGVFATCVVADKAAGPSLAAVQHAKPAQHLTPAKPARPAQHMLPVPQLTPAKHLTPAKPARPVQQLTPAQHMLPAQHLTPAQHMTHAKQAKQAKQAQAKQVRPAQADMRRMG